MSGASSRRPRGTAKAPSEPKIEREKIRHRRPKDLDFADDDEVGFPQSPETAGPDHDIHDQEVYVEEVDLDWTAQHEAPAGRSDWDDDSEDDWTLDVRRVDPRFSQEEELEEEEGVIWEDDAFADPRFFHPGEDYAFDEEADPFDVAPRFEPPGHRNARSRAPRPAPPPRPQVQQYRPQGKQQRPPPRQRGAAPGWDEPGQPHFEEPLEQEVVYRAPRRTGGRPSRPMAPPGAPPADSGRFARTLAATGVIDDRDRRHMPPQPHQQPRGRRGPRHHSTPPPTVPLSRKEKRQFAARYGNGRGRGQGLFIATVFFLIFGISWLAYQAISPNGGQPLIDRLTSILPFPTTTRTAADTSFDAPATAAERALSDLVESSGQNGDDLGLSPGSDDPPVPQLKPQSDDQSQLRGIDDEAENLSALDRLLRFINPG